MSDLLAQLRLHTRALHDRLDGTALSGRVTDQTLSADDYRALVRWQITAHAVAEHGLADYRWPGDYAYVSRQGALRAEATAMGVEVPEVEPLPPPMTLSTAVGRAYVLEGSSLGGNMILGHLKANPAITAFAPFSFYDFQRRVGLQQWRAFTAFAKTREWSETEVAEAVQAAKEVFAGFESLKVG